MEKKVKRICEDARRAYDTLKEKTESAFSSYRAELVRIKQEAQRYKNEDEYVREHSDALKRITRQQIAAAEQEFCDAIHNEIVPELRAELVGYLTAKPDADFMQTMLYFNTFNIPMVAQEVRALAYDTAGNYMQIRALAAVAGKNGISVKFPGVGDYNKAIDRLEKMAQPPLQYCPNDYMSEGVAVWGDKVLRRADGTVYGTSGNLDSVYLLMQQQNMDSTMKALDKAGATWSAQIVPEISEYQVVKTEDGEEVSREAQRATDKLGAAQQVTAEDASEAQQIAVEVTAAQARAAKSYSDFEKYYLR